MKMPAWFSPHSEGATILEKSGDCHLSVTKDHGFGILH